MFLSLQSIPRIRNVNRYLAIFCIIALTVIVCASLRLELICLGIHAREKANGICETIQNVKPTGKLCSPLCQSREIDSFSCVSFEETKKIKFKAEWKNSQIVFKSPIETTPFHWYENGKKMYPSEKQFLAALQGVVRSKLNIQLPMTTLKMILKKTIHSRNADSFSQNEIDSLSTLVQDKEFLFLSIFSANDVFPKLVGTCSYYFSTEYIKPIQIKSSLMAFSDNVEEWIKKLQVAVQMMDLLNKLETDFQEPIHLCDIQLQHFGVSQDDVSFRYSDMNQFYPKSIIDKLFKNVTCQSDENCDFLDCRSKCSPVTKTCAHGVTNNNFQIVCEKIFLGWRRSNTLLVPGLLISQHTPSDLIAVIRQCGNPDHEIGKPRGGPEKNVIKRLYELLLEVEQTFFNTRTSS